MKRYTIGLITGVLLTASAFMFMGAQTKNLGDIKVKSITIENEDIKDKSTILLTNKSINMHNGYGGGISLGRSVIALVNNKGDFVVGLGINDGGGGLIDLRNGNEQGVIKINTTAGGGGSITILNGKNNDIIQLGPSDDGDHGLIRLYDRYGDFGWGKSGKK